MAQYGVSLCAIYADLPIFYPIERNLRNNRVRGVDNAHLDKRCKAFKAVFLDFSNAFHTLPHQGLRDKFAPTNPPHWLMKWVHNYLTGRSQYTRVNNNTSSVIQNNCSVLQGAVLSPFFSLFIPPIFTLNQWLPFLNTQMTSSSATLLRIPKAFSQ